MPLSKGSVVKGERGAYSLLRKISEGGMGIVWQAEVVGSGRIVVVKEPHVENSDERIAVERLAFESEVLRFINDESSKLTTDVKHRLINEHVVKYVDRSSNGIPLLVLEFVNGPLLSVAFERQLSERRAMLYAASLLRVVDALHSRGVIHRDISPGNIILNPARGLVLIDFGTSLTRGIAVKQTPRHGKVIVKRGYSSPELLEGCSDERSDIFSVGATTFYLLTGKNPGDFMSATKTMTTTVSQLDSRISKAISNIVETAMAPNPNERFQSAAAMSTAIEKSIGISGVLPHIVFRGTIIELRPGFIDIGREHTCDRSCEELGFKQSVYVRIADPQHFVEKHHARLSLETDGRCFIEDLKSVNRTAIKSKTGQFRILELGEKVELQDKDVVALAYNPTRGPYVTFEFDCS